MHDDSFDLSHEKTRQLILKALFQDDWLFRRLVLKGGNALALIYQVGMRTSLDLDFSMADDFTDSAEAAERIQKALSCAFSGVGILLFDFNFSPKPRVSADEWWGGYRAEFKLIPAQLAASLGEDPGQRQRRSLQADPATHKRKFSIEISKHEFIQGAELRPYQGFTVNVYPPVLLAMEKLRALLQQHPSYSRIAAESKRSRGRDLYDIWALCDHFSLKLAGFPEIAGAVFHAKRVDIELLIDLEAVRELHRTSWADVEQSVATELEPYDFYFDFVNKAARELYTAWKVNAP